MKRQRVFCVQWRQLKTEVKWIRMERTVDSLEMLVQFFHALQTIQAISSLIKQLSLSTKTNRKILQMKLLLL